MEVGGLLKVSMAFVRSLGSLAELPKSVRTTNSRCASVGKAMKAILLYLAANILASVAVLAQGQFLFANYAPPDINTPIKWGIEPPGFSIFGPGARVEFWKGTIWTEPNSLIGSTDFKTNSPSNWGYVNPVVVTVPGAGPGSVMDITVKVFSPGGLAGSFGPLKVVLGGGPSPIPMIPSDPLALQPSYWFVCRDCQADLPFVGFQRLSEDLLIWWSKGVLQEAPSIAGPWTVITNWSNPHIEPVTSDEGHRYFRAKLSFAPDSITGINFTFSITTGTSPFGVAGAYQLMGFGEDYSETSNLQSSTGTYVYASTGDRTAVINLNDELGGPVTTVLTFLTTNSGTFTNRTDGTEQTGTFTMECRSPQCLALGL